MVRFLVYRFLYMIVSLALISVVSFVIIQVPAGDFLSAHIATLETQGGYISESEVAALRKQYGLDQSVPEQYLVWISGIFRGDFGYSFLWNMPVATLVGERLLLTVTTSIITLAFTYAVAIPVGIYSATHQYSLGDYISAAIGFMGLATPNFLLALVLMFGFQKYLGFSVGGLFSPEYIQAPWSVGKVLDMLKHLPIPIIVIGTAGTASLIRVMRGCLLDELRQQYVTTARAKGVSERKLLLKYPVRVALNPIASTIGWTLPAIVSGATITAMVLDLPTVGPLILRALMSQDVYLSASILMFLSSLTIVGTFLSDLLLAWLDPRIRYGAEI
jgi:peptide/nickel transport system permease protein